MCVEFVTVDAEVYDEMHHQTINIHYHTRTHTYTHTHTRTHTHTHTGTLVAFHYAWRLVPGVSERQQGPRYLR